MQSMAFVLFILSLGLIFESMKKKEHSKQELVILILVFFYITTSHFLTSLAMLAVIFVWYLSKYFSRTALVFCLSSITVAWLSFNAVTYLNSNLGRLLGQALDFSLIFSTNLSGRIAGGTGHVIVSQVRIVYSALVILFGLIGVITVLRSKKKPVDKRVLLMLASFAVLVFIFSFGGELFMRIFMFSLIPLAYFAVKALFKYKRLMYAGLLFFVILAPSFIIIAHYGNEAIDYVPKSEKTGVLFLYATTITGQIVGGSIRSGDFRDYTYRSNYSMVSIRDLYISNRTTTLFTQPHDPYRDRFLCLSYETYPYFSAYMGDKLFVSELQKNITECTSYNLIYSNPSFLIYTSKSLNDTQTNLTGK
jgi:hypothetical protein